MNYLRRGRGVPHHMSEGKGLRGSKLERRSSTIYVWHDERLDVDSGLHRHCSCHCSTIGRERDCVLYHRVWHVCQRRSQGEIAQHRATLLVGPSYHCQSSLLGRARIAGSCGSRCLTTGLIVDLDANDNNSQIKENENKRHQYQEATDQLYRRLSRFSQPSSNP